MSHYAVGKRALGICDRCGFTCKLHDLQYLTINRQRTGLKVCDDCWEPDHPQNEQGRYPVRDAQALRDPRPDYGDQTNSRGHTVPVTGVWAKTDIGSVGVTVY